MVVTVTSLELRSVWLFFKLSWFGLLISRQAKAQQGFVKMKNTGFGHLHYTMTAWDSEEDVKAFARSGAHADAMKRSRTLAREIRTYTYAGNSLPAWPEAKRLLSEKGKVFTFK